MKIEDLERIVLVSDPKLSPDARLAAFTVTKPSIREDKYLSSIWLLDTKSLSYEQLTAGPSDHSPEWSPDGRRICFLSRRTLKEGEEGAELWIADVFARGEPRMLLKLDRPIRNAQWSPDGRRILFISRVGRKDEDVKVIEELPFWFNGEGFIYGLRDHVFVADVYSGNYFQLTSGDVNVKFARWSPNGRRVAFVAETDRLRPYIKDVFVVDAEGGEPVKLTRGNMTIIDLDWSPDGRMIVFRGHDLRRGLTSHYKVWVVDVEGGEPRCVFNADLDAVNAMNSDVRGPSSARYIQWVEGHIYFPVSVGGYVHLYRTDAEGEHEPVIQGEIVVEDFSISRELICTTAMRFDRPPEVYIYREGELKLATDFNGWLLREVGLGRPERFTFRASDGVEVEGWVLKPHGFVEGRKYPAILYIHGGPPTTYGEGFMHEFHVLAGEGFALIFMNPRGSSGYSEGFKDIRGRYGDRDYKDIMEGLDYVLEKFPFIDGERVGVTGGSYGGFMVNWIIGHTDRFKAAVTQRSICNWISDYGTTDIGFYFNEDQIAGGFGRPFWDERWFRKYWDMSPIKYVGNVKTPLLIIHSMEDYRCWMDQALQLFTALKVRGIPVRLVLFPKENHDLSRKGKPKHRVERLKQIVGWFKKYLAED